MIYTRVIPHQEKRDTWTFVLWQQTTDFMKLKKKFIQILRKFLSRGDLYTDDRCVIQSKIQERLRTFWTILIISNSFHMIAILVNTLLDSPRGDYKNVFIFMGVSFFYYAIRSMIRSVSCCPLLRKRLLRLNFKWLLRASVSNLKSPEH